jgi:predicted secreted protein
MNETAQAIAELEESRDAWKATAIRLSKHINYNTTCIDCTSNDCQGADCLCVIATLKEFGAPED